MIEYAVLGGFVLDCLFGDPVWLPHPVVYMGKAISALESACGPPAQNVSGGTAGRGHCGVLPAGGYLSADEPGLPGSCRVSRGVGLAVQMFWCGQALAAKGLAQESTNV